MKMPRAIKMLNIMTAAIQKMRSNIRECGIDDDIAEMLLPWIFGKKCPLNVLISMINRAQTMGKLSTSDFFNMMVIAYRLQPEIAAFASLITHDVDAFPTEEPDYMQYLGGWENE